MLASATTGSPRILNPSFPWAWVSQGHLISCSVLSEWGTDALRRPTRRGQAKSKAEPQELCEQRREREISPSSLRSSGLNPTINLMYLHLWNTWIDKESSQIEEVDFGSNNIYIFFPFSLFVSVYVYVSVCDFICIASLLPFVLGFCLSVFFVFVFFSILFSNCYHCGFVFWFGCSLLSFFLSFFFSLLLWVVWMKGSWCSSQASGLCLWGGRAKFRTLVHKRHPSST